MADFTDAQMLDWLDRNNQALNDRYGTRYGWRVVRSPNVVRVMTERPPSDSGHVADFDLHDSAAHGHTSVRAAITEAMRAAGVPGAVMADVNQARTHLDEAAKAISGLDSMLAIWFPALGSQRQQLAKVLGHIADASAVLAAGVSALPTPKLCPGCAQYHGRNDCPVGWLAPAETYGVKGDGRG